MPALSPSRLVDAVTAAFDECDATAILTSSLRGHPRQFIVQSGRDTIELWVYMWTLTHGGGSARPKDEYRIQLTGVTPPLLQNPSGLTILVGYEPNINCFAGFDISKHGTFSTRSPSIQIPITTLHQALQNGFSFVTKGNDEVAIGIRPDQLLAYCINSEMLHRQGADAEMVSLLTKAASLEEIAQEDVEAIPTERKRVIREVARLSRDSSFRRKVLLAYDRRCAVTRMQLRLIDAAHILPVGADGSADVVTNGLCLSPTYHRAFDRGLIYLNELQEMHINPEKEQELITHRLDGGLEDFKSYLGRQVHLPADRQQWPSAEFICQANLFRKITT
ncbi:MAG: HNH endonuclease [Chloroflexota bacterium]